MDRERRDELRRAVRHDQSAATGQREPNNRDLQSGLIDRGYELLLAHRRAERGRYDHWTSLVVYDDRGRAERAGDSGTLRRCDRHKHHADAVVDRERRNGL